MEILSSFTHPQVFPNLYEFISSAQHKHFFFILWKLRVFINVWLPTFFQIYYFEFSRRKRFRTKTFIAPADKMCVCSGRRKMYKYRSIC